MVVKIIFSECGTQSQVQNEDAFLLLPAMEHLTFPKTSAKHET